MAPTTIHLVRHAQGYHNISVANHAMHDPLLTPMGEEQCRLLQKDFPHLADIDCVVASPLKRTVYTALLSFAPAIESKRLKVIALPELQETSDLPCDTGSSVAEIEREFKGKPVNTELLHLEQNKSWNDKRARWAPTASAIEARARDAREWLLNRPEKEIVVVTHGGFLHYFTQDWSDTHRLDGTPSAGRLGRTHAHRLHRDHDSSHGPHDHHRQRHRPLAHKRSLGTGWANTEFRHYTFDNSNGEATLVETPESRKKRAGDQKPLSKEEQKNLQRTAQQQWLEQEKKEQAYRRAADIQSKLRQDRRDRDLGGYAYQ